MTQPLVTSSQELETWLDEFMSKQMAELHIPGAAFSLVQNGELFFAKGYGYADLQQQIPVVGDRTLFRVGGNSKLFVATAIMQLVEKGLLNLEDNINKYLPEDLQIEDDYPQPVTITNLLTHTAGFHPCYLGAFVREPSDFIPLKEYLKTRMPKRVQPPGEEIIFTNYAYALAGYIVELVADIPFTQYINENILQPLEMEHSSFELSSHLALSYEYKEKERTHQAFPYNYHQITLTDALNATATDIANFAIAHLQQGRFKSQRILRETTTQQMQQRQFTNDPRLPGMCWGFWEYLHPKYRQRAIGHDGGVLSGYRSLFYLLPQYDLGFFMVNNGCGNISGKLIEQFCDRYFSIPEDLKKRSPPQDRQSLKRYQGSYRSSIYSRKSTLDKIDLLWSSPLRLKAETDGTISVPETLKSDRPIYFQEIEPLVLQVKNHPDNYIVAREDSNNKITTLLTLSNALEKLSWYETNSFHWILFWYFVSIFLSGLVVGVFTLAKFPGSYYHQFAQLLAVVTCGLNLVCAFGMLTIARIAKNSDRFKLVYGVPKTITFLLGILLLTSVLALCLPVFVIAAWLNNEWLLIERLHYSLVTITALGLIPFLNYWNLLGFRY